MDRSRISRGLGISVLVALFVGVVGGWVLSRSPDDTDANPGSIPGIPVNTDTTGEEFPFVELRTLGGDPVTVSTGELRPMVVNFWFLFELRTRLNFRDLFSIFLVLEMAGCVASASSSMNPPSDSEGVAI